MSKMNLAILFGQSKEEYEGQYAPEPLECWSEFNVEENPEGFEEACDDAKANNGYMTAYKVINIEVDQDKIRELLIGTPTLKGEIDRPPLKFSAGDKVLYYWTRSEWRKGTIKDVPEYRKRAMYQIIDEENPDGNVKNVAEDSIKLRDEMLPSDRHSIIQYLCACKVEDRKDAPVYATLQQRTEFTKLTNYDPGLGLQVAYNIPGGTTVRILGAYSGGCGITDDLICSAEVNHARARVTFDELDDIRFNEIGN